MKMVMAKRYVSAMAVAALVLGAGTVYTVTTMYQGGQAVYAYTSAENAQDPATAQDDYVVTIPDANLRKALNKVIATATGAPRTDTQAITAGEMRTVTGATADFNETGAQNFLSRSGIKNLEGIQFLTNAETINLGVNLLSDENALRPLSSLTKLKRLNLFHAFRTGDPAFTPPVNILAPIKDLPALEALHLNTNKLTPEHLVVLKDTPKLKTLLIAGNNILNLNDMFKDGGFATLDQTSTFSSQKHEITLAKDQAVFANPVRDYNGAIVPITETATVKNVDAGGQPSQAGGHIKLVDTYDKDKVDIRWSTPPVDSARFGAQTFSGTITVNYDLPARDTEAPIFSPEQPAKIVSRKGVALNLNDVTAQDNQGGSGIAPGGVTHNAAAINLDPNSPAKGNYELTYSVRDNAGNQATVKRSIEITDADALQQKVDSVGGNFLDGYTLDTKNAVVAAQRHAEGIIAANGSTQDQINEALRDLERAIRDLRANRRPIEQATSQYNREPEYVQHDPAVSAALQQANDIYNLPTPGPTPAQVKQAADGLIQAMENAKQAEADRQTAAREAFDKAEQDKTASAIADAKNKIAALKDAGTRQTMETELASIERDYNNAKQELEDIIARAEDPKTTENANDATKRALADQVRLAKALLAGDPSQADLQNMKSNVEQKINELRPDTAALEAVINSVPNESAFVQQDAEVVKKLATANDIKNNPAATVQQIATAKSELEKAIADARAVEAEQQAEAQRQAEAEAAVVAAEAAKTPDTFAAAQAKIDAVKTDAVKQQLQDRLNTVKQAYQAKKDELKALIDRAKLPETVDGMTKATVDALSDELTRAEATNQLANAPQSAIETAIRDLQSALDGLQTDKAPLAAAEDLHNDQPDYIKANPTVAAAFRKAQGTRAMPNPPVKQVRDDAKALEDAILAAAQTELNAQQSAATALQQATDKLNAQLAPDEMPAIDVAALEAQVAAVQDPARKMALQTELDALKAKIAVRQKQVDDYKQSEEGKRAEAERKAREEAERQAREATERNARAKAEQLADTGAPLVAPVAGGLGAMLAGAWALIRRKRQ
ncbi:MAG: hypothetical protein Q4F02_02405 [Candidatus Saccharibacteria bacterium]|nr:hypothetical protein [Candidatus Saccharibacteria bacterium]